MRYSRKAIQLIKELEGFRPNRYKDGSGYSIGYGTFIDTNEERAIQEPISPEMGERLLIKHLDMLIDQLDKWLEVSVNQNQIDALLTFAYNVGSSPLKTVVQRLNEGQTDEEITAYMRKFVHSGNKKLPHLIMRREKEIDLFLSPVFPWLLLLLIPLVYAIIK
ncbi:lysozyme [Roseivirga pacifica]|uniref:lysozyme n=1 Tax=Roseivirga pacifica TaxID=1267423 RepID=UPI003BAAA263